MSSTQSGHDVGRNQSGELKREVCLILVVGGGVNSPNDIVVELLDSDLIHFWETFNYESADTVNILFLKRIDILDERSGGLTRSKKRCNRVVNGEIGQLGSQNLVREIDHAQGVVDEQVTAHQLVNEELFD